MGEMIGFSCGDASHQGYLARSVSGTGKGVIVLQEWWGLVGHIKDVADRFAAEGFTALAPDLYHGVSTTEPDEAGSLLMALNIPETERALACAARRLLDDPATLGDQVGVIGFCMGGKLSYFAAATSPELYGAAVNFYGIHPNVHPPYAQATAPLLGIFAEIDDYASPAVVAALDQELTSLGKAHEFHTYPGVHHAFFNNDRPAVYDSTAAEDAWNRTLAFLRTNL